MPLDIDASYYKTGTATVAANGTTVTGQGTAWLQSVRAGDLFGTHVGDPVRIASVNSNTQLTLAYPWKGPAQTESAYEIQFTPYDTGYQAAVRELLQMLASGNVEAFADLVLEAGDYIRATGPGVVEKVSGKNLDALRGLQIEEGKFLRGSGPDALELIDGAKLDALRGLTGGAEMLPYFNGNDTMAQTALTEFARTLLDDADAATARGTLGASAMKTLAPGVDLNTVTASGFYRVQNIPNPPPGGFPYDYGQLIVSDGDGNSDTVTQMLFAQGTAEMSLRTGNRGSDVWTPWRRLWHDGNITPLDRYGGTMEGVIVSQPVNNDSRSSVMSTGEYTFMLGANAAFIWPNFSGMMIVNRLDTGAVQVVIGGGGSVVAVASVGDLRGGGFVYAAPENGYAYINGSTPSDHCFMGFRTRLGA